MDSFNILYLHAQLSVNCLQNENAEEGLVTPLHLDDSCPSLARHMQCMVLSLSLLLWVKFA